MISKKLTVISLLLFMGSCSSGIHYYRANNAKRVFSGLENFIDDSAEDYAGKKAVIVTNHSGVDFSLNRNIDLFRQKGINVIMVLAPEHGIYGYQNEYDRALYHGEPGVNTVVYNLHHLDTGSKRFLLKRADLVIFDIQDMGMRCYTYVSNLKMIMDAMKGTGRKLIVLDRPNPAGFLGIDGAFLNKRFYSKFVSSFPAPLFYGMTIGEAALYYQGEYARNVNLEVITMSNYSRDMFFHETSLPWVPPSPNLPTYESSIIYTAVVLMEGINISLGRGTTKPFEYIGAPWIEPGDFCAGLEKLGLRSFKFRPVFFEPAFNKYQGEKCGGAHIFYTGGSFRPVEVSFKIIQYVLKKYPQARWMKFKKYFDVDALAGTDLFRKIISRGGTYGEFEHRIKKDLEAYEDKRDGYLLY